MMTFNYNKTTKQKKLKQYKWKTDVGIELLIKQPGGGGAAKIQLKTYLRLWITWLLQPIMILDDELAKLEKTYKL